MSFSMKRKGIDCVTVSLKELLQISKNARELALSDFLMKRTPAGVHSSRLFGRGMEFAECRRYQEGDDIRAIDWRVTARTGKVHTKLFAVEKERQVLICTDMRSSMFFGTKGVFKSVQASLISASFAWGAVLEGNRLGGIIFDDAKQEEFRPALGKRGVLPILQYLAESSTAGLKKFGHQPASLDHAIQSIKRVASPGSMVFVISDFRQLSQNGRDLLIQLSSHCDLCLCFLFDPLETFLPKNGLYPISDGQNEMQLSTYDKMKVKEYQKQFSERRESIASLGHHRHIRFIECSTEEECSSFLNENFRTRKKCRI